MNKGKGSPIATVVVPSVGEPALVLGCVQRLLESTTVPVWQILLVLNPVEENLETLAFLRQQVIASVNAFNAVTDNDSYVDLEILVLPKAAGWTGAVNAGATWIAARSEIPEFIVVMNDDVLVSKGWLARLGNAASPSKILLQGEVGSFGDGAEPRDVCAWGKIGIVGPCSNEVAGVQKVKAPEVKIPGGAAFTLDGSILLDDFANEFAKGAAPYPMSASFLSGMCLLYTRECFLALVGDVTYSDGKKRLLRPEYKVGGFDDNDIAVRAAILGYKLAVAGNVYVHHLGHQTLDTHFPESRRGLANSTTYLKVWEEYTKRSQSLVAVYRVGLKVPWDVAMLTSSLRRMKSLVDGIAILFTSDPAELGPAMLTARSRADDGSLGFRFGDYDLTLTKAENPNLDSSVEQRCLEYVKGIVGNLPVAVRFGSDPDGNERNERNTAISLGLTLDPDWMISVDHDEIPENRITRRHLLRLMHHPNPEVTHYDVGWLNHWDTPRVSRVDPPWAQDYVSGMRGFRIWRVHSSKSQVILAGNDAGLHCGNIPDAGEVSKRVAGFRFRHYGYLRAEDRFRKYKRYNEVDPTPSPVLTQASREGSGGYDHLVNEEFMRLQPYRPDNGIGLTMLWHDGESADDLFRWLDQTYALVDYIVLVWTGQTGTSPSEEFRYLASRYGARWVHHPLDDDLAAARNSGVSALKELGVRWCWVMDPDEYLASPFSTMVSIRRMAETTDCLAWLFRFRNYRPDGQYNWSENTRLFEVGRHGVLRFNGRVHETIENSLNALIEKGVKPNMRFAPFVVDHFGLSGGNSRTQKKLARYTHLLCRQIADDPRGSPGAWVSLGLQFGNDGKTDEQLRCYEAAVATAGKGYLPFREMAMFHLRVAKDALSKSLNRLSRAHGLHKPTAELLEVLNQAAPEQPVLGAARGGEAASLNVDLDALLGYLNNCPDK